MCGIFGIIGLQEPLDTSITYAIIDTLSARGYDSIGFVGNSNIAYRHCGSSCIQDMKESLETDTSTTFLMHVRWATNGEATLVNCHPFQSARYTLVHNGIIKNVDVLPGSSDRIGSTDSESILCTLERLADFESTMKTLNGSWAIVVQDAKDPESFYISTCHCPLIIGFNHQDPNLLVVASQLNTLLMVPQITHVYVVPEISTFTLDQKMRSWLFDNNHVIERPYMIGLDCTLDTTQYSCYMHKEIMEQSSLSCPMLSLPHGYVITLVGCGSSLNALRYAAYYLTQSKTVLSTEFDPFKDIWGEPNTNLVIFVSQSGETYDTNLAVRRLKTVYPDAGCCCLVNNIHSQLARIAAPALDVKAGVENAVAATKTYTQQIRSLLELQQPISRDFILRAKEIARSLMRQTTSTAMWLVGAGPLFAVLQEACLKLQEVALQHTVCMEIGALKHGPLALIDETTVVIVHLWDTKNHTLIDQLKARRSQVIVLTNLEIKAAEPYYFIVIYQWLALLLAQQRGLNPDKPRNLAKTVTVN